jgi:hypothetical protein
MHREEYDEVVRCAGCGAEVQGSRDRCFAFGEDSLLCWDCAIARGGEYEPEIETWVRPPDMTGLLEQPPAAPMW